MTTHYTGGKGNLFIQPDGPNTKTYYLGCHLLGDIDEPRGDITLNYCRDPRGPDMFQVVSSTQGQPGAVTTTVTTDVTSGLDWLERTHCEFTLYANMFNRGKANEFTNFERVFILRNARITSAGLSNLVARSPDDNTRSEQTFDISAEELIRFVVLDITRQTLSETMAINDLTFCNDVRCRTSESPALDSCQTGYAVADADTGVAANVLTTSNGATWAVTAADPFAADKMAIAIECFPMGRDDIRVIAANGTTTAASGPLIAYSDDGGATWTTVELGETPDQDGQFIPTRHSLFALNADAIWAGDNGGALYKSEDGGVSWDLLDDGTVITDPINAIHFIDEDTGWMGGDNNAVARSIDGGISWEVVAGPAGATDDVTTIWGFDRNRVWVGFNDGTWFYTSDAGDNWEQSSFSGSGTGQIRAQAWLNDLIGYMVHNTSAPAGRVFYTINGGKNWTAMDTPTNSGLNAIYMCDLYSFFIAGEANGGTGVIAKAIP
jgi:photosystem II stability/assembly factor-like uncharacterized protein